MQTIGCPKGIEADSEGITVRPMLGRVRTVSWEKMRLLTVAYAWPVTPKTARRVPLLYTLSGDHKSIRWQTVLPNPAYVSVGIDIRKWSQGYQQLLALIEAHTGLVPRTFDSRLQQTLQAAQTGLPSTDVLAKQE